MPSSLTTVIGSIAGALLVAGTAFAGETSVPEPTTLSNLLLLGGSGGGLYLLHHLRRK